MQVARWNGAQQASGGGGTAAARRRRWLVPAAWAALAAALFLCYLRVSQTEPGDSYGAVFTLQAYEMLHGNPLLHGWWLSDVSFYTTELPEYMLLVLARGVSPSVVHVAGAVTYTLLVLIAALLAKGRAKGRAGILAALITAGIMLSPQLGSGVYVLLLAPDHVGTCVPVLLAWLIVDRAPHRWYVPAAVGALLAWVLVADPYALLIGVLPLVAVAAARLYSAAVVHRLPPRAQWFEASLIVAGLAAVAAAQLVLLLLRALGGFVVWPVAPALTSVTDLPHHLLLLVEGLPLLFGADVFGQQVSVTAALLLAHLAGLALAACATWAGLRRFSRDGDLVVQVLAAAILINLVAFLLWSRVTDITSAREMAAVLPFGAVLAGRLLAGRLAAARLLPALSVVLVAYVVSLGQVAAHPPQPPQDQQLATWLSAHHFRYGIGASWLGSAVTLASGERVELRPITLPGSRLAHSEWESKSSWFDPRRHYANFVVLDRDPPQPPMWGVQATFGTPARTYRVGSFTVLVWNENLLTRLG